ncbi:hypothetical protein R3W88_019282 [Solanum pinnatisectum]|uniref:Uncharacterized protein n=1 Tax=Solanum pinnatisectum TaxID=50273 RepID=A0AAV9KLV3_9SOLN|nr:hypothetical protein R3W88_019282 [Solanum pinnatisectum]
MDNLENCWQKFFSLSRQLQPLKDTNFYSFGKYREHLLKFTALKLSSNGIANEMWLSFHGIVTSRLNSLSGFVVKTYCEFITLSSPRGPVSKCTEVVDVLKPKL